MISSKMNEDNYPTTCQELKIGGTTYRVTSVYTGKINLQNALEELIVRRVLMDNAVISSKC